MTKAPSNPIVRTLKSIFEGRTPSWLMNVIVIPLLALLALVLPPLALPQRLLSAGFTDVAPTTGGVVAVADGTEFAIPAGATKGGTSIKLTFVPRDSFLKGALAQTLPTTLDVKSPLYQPDVRGPMPSLAILSIALPEGADPSATLDVYGHVGKTWIKLPFQIYAAEQRIEATLSDALPDGVVVAQTGAQDPIVSLDLGNAGTLPAAADEVVNVVHPIGLTIADDGGIAGSVPAAAEPAATGHHQVMPTVGNRVGDQLRTDLTDDMIANADIRRQHVQALVDLAVDKLYPGLNIDYQEITPDNKNEFTLFVRELAQALHAQDKLLSVVLAMPTPKAADTWDTGPFDWIAIGQAADIVKIPLPTRSEDYAGSAPLVQSYLQWAVGRIDRYKLELALSANGRDEFGKSVAPIPFATALKLMGPLTAVDTVELGNKVTFDLPKLRASGLKYDANIGLYSFTYQDDKSQGHTVWVESADSLARKMALALQFNLRGVNLRDAATDAVDQRVWEALKGFRQAAIPQYKSTLAVVWSVNGKTVGKAALTDPKFVWTAPSQAGELQVQAAISFDDSQSAAGTVAIGSAQVRVVAPPPEETPTPVPTAAPKPTTAPTRQVAATGTYPFSYGAQLNWSNNDHNIEMDTLRNMGFTWAKIQVRWCDMSGGRGQADLSVVSRLLDAANARGVKVLLSVVCAPKWSRADGGAGGSGPPDNMQDAAEFMGSMAAQFCGNPAFGAIEVWNEHNLLTEWHGKPISAALYMDMLKRSYSAIKARCPRTVVVSGAPTPTGVNSAEAIDDVAFLQQLYANGLAQYSDAIGAHPSGFCNAPDAVEGTANPCGGSYTNHRSFFIRRTLEEYRKVMLANNDGRKQIWPTEFGWGVDLNPKPGYEYERNITEDMQAQWLVRAYQMMKNMGYVGVSILWNLDFTDMGNETGAFHVVGRPAQGALSGMVK